MDTDRLVEKRLDEAQTFVAELAQGGFEVSAAVWLKESEDGRWYFYIISPLVDAEGIAQAYQQLHALISAQPKPVWIEPLKIRLLGPSNPLARDVLADFKRPGGPQVYPSRWGGIWLGNTSVEEAYFYAAPTTTP